MYLIDGINALKIEDLTFSDLNMKEESIEEILRQNIDMICNDEESLLLVGQQVKNQIQARSDLIAVDQDGNLVLIELKRDKKILNIEKKRWNFRQYDMRQAGATIQSTDELIQNLFAPYVEKHREEFGKQKSYHPMK